MVLILFSWLYILFSSLSFGIGFLKLLRSATLEITITSILGLFSITIFASIWAIFGPINSAFHSVLLLLSILLGLRNKEEFLTLFQKTKTFYVAFPSTIKALLLISSFLLLAQSATLPFIIDNETYYIQTIKWLNEYGFVPGLANLHIYLGQTSGWHITQSVFSFSFLYDRFNDLNGFCLLIGNFWAFQKLHCYFKTKIRLDLVFGLLPLTYAFVFQFISAPSPDFPVYIFGLILFSVYLESHVDNQKETFGLITVLALFVLFIKITAFVLFLLPFFVLIKQYEVNKKQLFKMGILSSLVLILFIVKNTILTGYPLFPLTFITMPDLNYRVPIEIMDFLFSQNIMHFFYIPFGTLDATPLSDIMVLYFFRNGVDSIVAIATIVILIISPITIYKKFPKQNIWSIYFIFILLLILLVFSSPQYRFYVYFTIFFGLLLLSIVLTSRKKILALMGLSLTLVALLLFVPMSFNRLTNNKSLALNSTFKLKNLLIPEPNTNDNQSYNYFTKENLTYYSPIDYPFFWITGNGDLPCVNAEQVTYFETYFHVLPQLRGASVKDGFYAKKTNADD